MDGLNREIEIRFGPGTPFPCTIGVAHQVHLTKKTKANAFGFFYKKIVLFCQFKEVIL